MLRFYKLKILDKKNKKVGGFSIIIFFFTIKKIPAFNLFKI